MEAGGPRSEIGHHPALVSRSGRGTDIVEWDGGLAPSADRRRCRSFRPESAGRQRPRGNSMGLKDSRGDTSRYAEFCISLNAKPDGNHPAGPCYRPVAVGPDGREAQGYFVNPLTSAPSSFVRYGDPSRRLVR